MRKLGRRIDKSRMQSTKLVVERFMVMMVLEVELGVEGIYWMRGRMRMLFSDRV
jgi:hypothetical protein